MPIEEEVMGNAGAQILETKRAITNLMRMSLMSWKPIMIQAAAITKWTIWAIKLKRIMQTQRREEPQKRKRSSRR